MSLPSSEEFYDLGLAFRREEEDEDDDNDNSRVRDEGERTMTITTTTLAMGGARSKDDETRTLFQVAATAMALLYVSLAPRHCATRERLGSLEIYSAE